MRRYITIILFFIILNPIFTQEKGTFRGYISSGFNINQISGDSVTGFNYWGFTGGVGTYFMISDKLSANLELNYSMRGASGESFNEVGAFIVHRTIHTNYIEVPVLLNYHDHKIARFGAGIVLSNLISTNQWYNEKQFTSDRITNFYKPLDIGFIASISFNIKEHFGFNMRMIHSILPANNPHPNEDDHYHITLSARGLYYF